MDYSKLKSCIYYYKLFDLSNEYAIIVLIKIIRISRLVVTKIFLRNLQLQLILDFYDLDMPFQKSIANLQAFSERSVDTMYLHSTFLISSIQKTY